MNPITTPRPVVAVVGAGFSGALASLQILHAAPRARVVLIERTARFGRGLAYSTDNPRHLLNVRVGNMSAWPGDPDHLSGWLTAAGHTHSSRRSAFVSRETYGAYIASMLKAAVARPDGAERLLLVHDEVVGIERRAAGFVLALAMGRTLTVDAVVLALGGFAPAPPFPQLCSLPESVFIANPWSAQALAGLEADSRVVLVGTGLTMVDVALSLDGVGHSGPVLAISRRGLAPRRHEGAFAAGPDEPPPALLSWRLRLMRERAAAVGWRQAVDEVRPFAQQIWRRQTADERRRFLRHLRPWWDVHRHRMAPAVADRIEAMRAEGRLVIKAGRFVDVARDGAAARIAWRRRGADHDETVTADRVINCTGPGADVRLIAEPVVGDLLARGLARPDPLGLGFDVSDDCRLVDAGGCPDPWMFAVGPLTRGAFWEITAVPDIRDQVAAVAMSIASALAAGREGVGPARSAELAGNDSR